MSDAKKIIIDEDWKSRVQAEKEEAAHTMPTSPSQSAAGQQPAYDPGDISMPPASLELLVSSLATESLMALGAVPHPATGKPELRPNQAKYLIDTIDVLRQKTGGNLTSSEQQMMESVLHELRMAYIAVTQMQPASPIESPPIDHLA
jgi:hypothetical protein